MGSTHESVSLKQKERLIIMGTRDFCRGEQRKCIVKSRREGVEKQTTRGGEGDLRGGQRTEVHKTCISKQLLECLLMPYQLSCLFQQ